MRRKNSDHVNQEGSKPLIALPQKIALIFAVIAMVMLGFWASSRDSEPKSSNSNSAVPESISRQFSTDFSQITIDPNQLLDGGPGKNGIPALLNPEFIPIFETKIADTTRGILVESGVEKKFYPYNILVWHEIINDTVGGEELAVTFCPLCGSAVVYEREIEGTVEEFRVSGLLYESNMIMYDTGSESFFSQSLGEGVAGEHTGKQLSRYPFQLLELFEVKKDHPDAQIVSTETGHTRDYSFYPYGNYDNSPETYFPVANTDERYTAKEIFYIVPHNGDSYAFRIGELADGDAYEVSESDFMIEKQGGEVTARSLSSGEVIPSYYEMWFSWATQHPESQSVIDPS